MVRKTKTCSGVKLMSEPPPLRILRCDLPRHHDGDCRFKEKID